MTSLSMIINLYINLNIMNEPIFFFIIHMEYEDLIMYNLTCFASLLALTVVLYVRIKLTIC